MPAPAQRAFQLQCLGPGKNGHVIMKPHRHPLANSLEFRISWSSVQLDQERFRSPGPPTTIPLIHPEKWLLPS